MNMVIGLFYIIKIHHFAIISEAKTLEERHVM